jgi:hypothetical protein
MGPGDRAGLGEALLGSGEPELAMVAGSPQDGCPLALVEPRLAQTAQLGTKPANAGCSDGYRAVAAYPARFLTP